MRFLTRLHVCAAAAFVVIIYFSWRRPSTAYIRDNFQRVWKNSPRRVVVFGDDWSDTGEYRVAPPKGSTRDRNAAQGDLWVETLCKELTCDFVDNFARSVPDNVRLEAAGSMVDSTILLDVAKGVKKDTIAAIDFKTQVQQFIEFDKKKWRIPGRHTTGDELVIFTVLFGIWDLLKFSDLDKDAAVRAIDRSIQELFHNLDILADYVETPKVTVPNLMDVTFLPRYSGMKNEASADFAQKQHQSVFLWTYWNTALSRAASEWDRGELFVLDVHEMIMEEVRAKQLFSNRITDSTGYGQQEPLFHEVQKPCLVRETNANASNLQAAAQTCTDPSAHLFWDDMHLSGPAHELIGKEAARLVRGSETANRDARQRATLQSATDEKSKSKDGFQLKFPPGY